MSGRAAIAAQHSSADDDASVTAAYLAAKPGFRRADARRWAPELWHQVAAVHAALSGPDWQMRLAADAPLPSWLIELCSGFIGSADDIPTPTLFRTAGISTAWRGAPQDHLELRCRGLGRGDERGRVLRVMDWIEQLGGGADADAYVIGDGHLDGMYRAEIHAIFGVFESDLSPAQLSAHGRDFRVSAPTRRGRRSVTYTWTPRTGGQS